MMQVLFVNQTPVKFSRSQSQNIQRILTDILFILDGFNLKNKSFLKKSEISLVFLDEKSMKNLNNQFRKKNKITDVLSFEALEPHSLGELVFCLPQLKRQARQQKHSLGLEFSYMLIHGILHLLGYDHEISDQEEKKMFKIQDEVFEQLTSFNFKLELDHVTNY